VTVDLEMTVQEHHPRRMTLFRNAYRIETARLWDWDYRNPGWYFVTLCTGGHRHFFGEIRGRRMELSSIGWIAYEEIKNVPNHFGNVRLDEFVVMPNHVHAIWVIEGPHRFSPDSVVTLFQKRLDTAGSPSGRILPSLGHVVGAYKSAVSRVAHRKGFTEFAWQSRFYDHLIRGNANVAAVRNYILNNPANWDKDRDNRQKR